MADVELAAELAQSGTLLNMTGRALPLLVEDTAGPIAGNVWDPELTRSSRFRLVTELPSVGSAHIAEEELAHGTLESTVGALPLADIKFAEPSGLPELSEGVLLIVPTLVALISEREDLVVVHGRVRDGQGKSLGVLSVGRLTRITVEPS